MEKALPAIPAKRYFTIGEVSELCGVKPYVLRYWEQEFTQLKPMKRRGNRRYYQHHEVLLIRRIRELLYEQGFTISGARNRLSESVGSRRHDDQSRMAAESVPLDEELHKLEVEDKVAVAVTLIGNGHAGASAELVCLPAESSGLDTGEISGAAVRQELLLIRNLLSA